VSGVDVSGVDVSGNDVSGNNVIQVLGSGEGSFVRGVLRSLTRERRALSLGTEKPFELRAENAHHLVLADTASGTTLLLNAFGTTNVATFAQFLEPKPAEVR